MRLSDFSREPSIVISGVGEGEQGQRTLLISGSASRVVGDWFTEVHEDRQGIIERVVVTIPSMPSGWRHGHFAALEREQFSGQWVVVVGGKPVACFGPDEYRLANGAFFGMVRALRCEALLVIEAARRADERQRRAENEEGA